MQRHFSSLLFSFVFVLFFGISQSQVYAQPPVNQQMLKDRLPSQLDPSTLSPAQLSNLLGETNNTTTQQGADKNAVTNLKKDKESADSFIKKDTKPEINPLEQTFGYDVFINSIVTDISELSTPPLDYPIGVGDHVIISLWGGAELQEDYVVSKDGAIFPQNIGKINVQGMSFENMKATVVSKFRRVVPAGTNISVSLGQPRTINVNVVGNVNKPGPVTISAFSNAFNVIAKAGGITEYGNLRSIQIKRAGKLIDELDVYQYLTTGDFGKHIYLQNNDFVIVTFVENKIQAIGQFKRPMYYQLKKGEGIKALLNYTGGLKPDAFATTIKVVRIEGDKQVQRDISLETIKKSSTADFALQDGDVVKAENIRKGIVNRIELQGEVNYPGTFEIASGEKLFEVIRKAGGLTSNTFLQKAYVFRGAGDVNNFSTERIELDLKGFEANKDNDSSNIELKANDIVQFFAKSDFSQQQFVEIFGEVRKPGKVIKYGKMSLQDVLFISGGLKPSAEFGRLEISSIVNMDSAQQGLNPTRTVIKSYAIQQDLSLDEAASKVVLMPYDQIYVRKNPTFELQQNIELKGLVKYPGQYPRLDKYERLSSYIERAGGLTENADVSGAVLMRRKQIDVRELGLVASKFKMDSTGNIIKDSLPLEYRFKEEPVSIDLFNALQNKNSKYDIILQENDVVFVPEINPFVSIVGKVQSPLKVAFDKQHRNLGYYIDKAGGFGVKPWRRRVFVTYANGRSRRTHNFLFLHFYPRVHEGAIVNVPARPEGQGLSDMAKATFIAIVPAVMTALIFKYIQ
jgi:protein involved in polysaccharide export with SLBB domain